MPSQRPARATPAIARLPFFYGWAVLACVCCAAFARQGPAVAAPPVNRRTRVPLTAG